jgi:hypothetical protein
MPEDLNTSPHLIQVLASRCRNIAQYIPHAFMSQIKSQNFMLLMYTTLLASRTYFSFSFFLMGRQGMDLEFWWGSLLGNIHLGDQEGG